MHIIGTGIQQVVHVDRVAPALDTQNRRSIIFGDFRRLRFGEKISNVFGVDGCRGDDEFKVLSFPKNFLE
jgi:hypothetical protein